MMRSQKSSLFLFLVLLILNLAMTLENSTVCIEDGDDYKIASVGVRLMGVLYDGMLVLALLFLVALIVAVIGTLMVGQVGTSSHDMNELPIWYQKFVQMPSFVLTLIGFYGLFWTKSGQTLGMQTWRLKTLTLEGGLLTWRQTFMRIMCACILPFVCLVIGRMIYDNNRATAFSTLFGFLLNYLFALVHTKGLAIHDWLSGTTTIRIAKYQHKTLWQTWRQR